MRIPPETIRSLVGLYTQRVGRAGTVGSVNAAGAVYRSLSQDAVSLSNEASLLNELKRGVKDMPDVDPQRVQQTRDELASGQFTVDADDVAVGLVMELAGGLT